MRRIIQITLLAALICLCILNVAVVRFIYVRYQKDFEPLRAWERRLKDVEHKVELKQRLSSGTFSREIATTTNDYAPSGEFPLYLNSRTNGTQRFELGGPWKYGQAVGAWLTSWKPHAEISKFDEFSVVINPKTGGVELLATPRTNETIHMRFSFTILVQDFPSSYGK